MASENGAVIKRHNPVDSICRKIKTIQMRDQESNPTLQIPKFQSRSYDSPQTSIKKNLEVALKNRTVKVSEKSSATLFSPDSVSSQHAQYLSPSLKWNADPHLIHSPSVTLNKGRAGNQWPLCHAQSCSTPLGRRKGLHSTFPQTLVSSVEFKNLICEDHNKSASHNSGSYVLDQKFEQDALPSPVERRLSLNRKGRGMRCVFENKTEMTEVSLICEEDLLNSIFHACDIQRRGKVSVSKVMDYLRYTTSRGTEDSGLDELCNMLDPEKKDISMDLDTYHAIMKEWIEDCRNKGCERTAREETVDAEDSMFKLHESMIAARRASGMNVTSGSLEALGGDMSKGDLETSDLITCVADLQFNNQKLQEQYCKLKMAMENMEEVNNRLMEENEELHNQAKSAQQAIARAKSLKDELEEMKTNLNLSEEKSAKILAQNKQLEKDNLLYIHKIASLQEETIKGALDLDGLREKTEELFRNNAELQMQLQEYENLLASKDTDLHKKQLHIEELKSSLVEYTSITETLRTEKAKLTSSIQQMQQELISDDFRSSAAYKYKHNIMEQMNCLLSELEFAQQSPEVNGSGWMYSFGHTTLDETLDREVLLLMQGPGPQQVEELKTSIQILQEDASGIADLLVSSFQQTAESEINQILEIIRRELKEKRDYWIEKLGLLEKQCASLGQEFIKMAGNLRRTRTEQFYMKKELSSRLHEVETLKILQQEAVEKADTLECQLQQATRQLEDAYKQVSEQDGVLCSAQKAAESLQGKLEEVITEQQNLQALNTSLSNTCQALQQKVKEQTTIQSLREKLSEGHLCGLCKKCCYKRFLIKDHCWHRRHWTSKAPCWYTRLLDALTLEGLHSDTRLHTICTCVEASAWYKFETEDLRKECVSDNVLLNTHTCHLFSGIQSDVDLPCVKMETVFSKESIEEQPSEVELEPSGNITQRGVHSTSVPISSDTSLVHEIDHLSTILDKQTLPWNILKPDLESKEMKAGSEQTPGEFTKSPYKSSEGYSTCSAPLQSSRKVKFDTKDMGSTSEKETEAEFLRLSLSFTCDLFTLEKRLQLEQRSRDLAEENLKKEISNCLKLLESLTSICEEEHQSQEIIKKLEKSLEFLDHHTARVARRAEMLGAIHQESRVSKAVEVMIQHVENLKRMYVKEHAELEELKKILQQNERSFGSLGERDESQNKFPSSLSSKPSSLRRVSISSSPKNTGNSGSDLPLAQLPEGTGIEENDDKLNRRSNSWRLMGSKQNEKRPSLQRLNSTRVWAEHEEAQSIKECEHSSELPDPEIKEEKARKLSLAGKHAPNIKVYSVFNKLSLWASGFKTSFFKINATLWVSLLLVLLLAAFISFLTGLSFQKHVDAAPVGTGDAWTSLQQLLWPYAGLRHNGQPPV
ncbi:inositol 1,4,5-triphosphate receptor associated 2 isoform X2 [Microcaecilia unicolor]|uniref:Lymphoid-restricted membrane protein isoform X2 n=1 Tax=Microcaecilia unicolor TaxID=1415580 RepID=A0A6P7Z315_9AMPH|nr:lymphoid-restricted membrane protein isoform X2 [Microcaecilia unicolor]